MVEPRENNPEYYAEFEDLKKEVINELERKDTPCNQYI